MELKQNEIIQIMRKRAALNQSELGVRAFNTSPESGRTKIKNFELGRQNPTDKDLEKIAAVLNVEATQLKPPPQKSTGPKAPRTQGVIVSNQVLKLYPDLRAYLEMLNKAAKINDWGLIDYLSVKLAAIFANQNHTVPEITMSERS